MNHRISRYARNDTMWYLVFPHLNKRSRWLVVTSDFVEVSVIVWAEPRLPRTLTNNAKIDGSLIPDDVRE
jgi:hypothetical protein